MSINKKEIKETLEDLIRQEEDITTSMKTIVFSYLKEQGKVGKNQTIDDIPYKKIIRTEFGLVI